MNITSDNHPTNLAMIKSFGANCESIENQDVMDSSQVCLDLQVMQSFLVAKQFYKLIRLSVYQ